MRVLAIALACLVCTGHGRRVQTASQGPTNEVVPSGQVGKSDQQRSLASLLLKRGGMSSFTETGVNYNYDDMDSEYGRRGGYGRRYGYARRGNSWLDGLRGGYGEGGYGRRGYYGSRAYSDGYGYRDGYSRRGYSGSYGYSDGYSRRGHSWLDGVRGGYGGSGYGRRGYSGLSGDESSRRGYSGSYGYSDGYARRGHSWLDGVRGGYGGGYRRRGYSYYDNIRGGYGRRGNSWRSRFGRGYDEDGYDKIGEREYFEDELIRK